jgi:hypothetical protein
MIDRATPYPSQEEWERRVDTGTVTPRIYSVISPRDK